MRMKIAFIGIGQVGLPLADQLQHAGHAVVLAARDAGSATVQRALARNPALQVAPLAEAVASADLVFLATPYAANADAVAPLTDALAGKVLVDCTNPVGPGLSHGLGSTRSGADVLQVLVPQARVVKAFTIYGPTCHCVRRCSSAVTMRPPSSRSAR
jgi:8-hydroxy-5-deazaflavin:NADPH oxidoreductase